MMNKVWLAVFALSGGLLLTMTFAVVVLHEQVNLGLIPLYILAILVAANKVSKGSSGAAVAPDKARG